MKVTFKKSIAVIALFSLIFIICFKSWLNYKEKEQKKNVEWLFSRGAGVKYAYAKWIRNLPSFLYDPAKKIFSQSVVIIRFEERSMIQGPIKIDSLEGLKKFKDLEVLELNSLLLNQEQIDELKKFYGEDCEILVPDMERWKDWEKKYGEAHKRYLKSREP